MNDFIGNDLCTEIIAQYINEVKEARGDSFSEDDINLAEIGRRTGISIGRLRNYINRLMSLPDMLFIRFIFIADKTLNRHVKIVFFAQCSKLLHHGGCMMLIYSGLINP